MNFLSKGNRFSILTISPKTTGGLFSLIAWLRSRIKSFLFLITKNPRFQNAGGPSAVLSSLVKGFNELGAEYNFNPKEKDVADTVCVLSGIDALLWAIQAKYGGKVKKIIAGPNLVVSPKDYGNILLSDEIDVVLVPSEWVRDFYVLAEPSLLKKIKVWAAGADEVTVPSAVREKVLVYKKRVSEEMFSFVVDVLSSADIPYDVLEYGRYKQDDYFRKLIVAKGLIYLTETESQGLALVEAWMHDVPTLVWDRKFFEFGKARIAASSAPYLTDECGISFSNKDDFKMKFDVFFSQIQNFHPRAYARKNFIHKVAAQRYLDIIREIM